MKRVLLLALVLIGLIAAAPARAEGAADDALAGIDLSAWQALFDEAGMEQDVRTLIGQLAGGEAEIDFGALIPALIDYARTAALDLTPSLIFLIGPALLWAVNRRVFSEDGFALSAPAGYICYLVEAAALIKLFSTQLADAQALIGRIGRLIDASAPVMTALTAAVGGVASAAIIQPTAVMAATLIASVVSRAALTLTGVAALLAVAGNLSEHLSLKGMFSLVRSAGNWLMGAALTAFLGVMTVCGMLASTRDGVSIRTAKYAVDNLFPVVGGEVADTLDAMVASAALTKNAAGVSGLMLLLALCLGPVIRLIVVMIVCRLSAALTEAIAEGPLTVLMDQFAGVMQMLLIAVGTCGVLFVILVGVAIASGNAIVMLR